MAGGGLVEGVEGGGACDAARGARGTTREVLH